jgi:hypothetical protein
MKASETAPMVQNPVFCITIPKTKVIPNVDHKTILPKEAIATASILDSFF